VIHFRTTGCWLLALAMVYPPNLPGVTYLDPTTMQVTTALSSMGGGGYQQQQQQQLSHNHQQQQHPSQHTTTTTMYLPNASSAVMTSSSLTSTPSPPSTTVAVTAMSSGPGPVVPDIFSNSNISGSNGSINNVSTPASATGGDGGGTLPYPMGMAAYHHAQSGGGGGGSIGNSNYASQYQHSPYGPSGPMMMMMDSSRRGGAPSGGGGNGGGGGGVSAQMMYSTNSAPSHGSGGMGPSGMRMTMMMPPAGQQGGMNLGRGMGQFPNHGGGQQGLPQQYAQAEHQALQQQQQQMGVLPEAAYPPPIARSHLQNAAANASGSGTAGNRSTQSIAVDEEVSENSQSIRICIDMPGVHSKDLKVQLRSNGVLEVRAIRRRTGLDGTTVIKKHKIARRYAIDAQTVDVNRVVADLALGVLVITAPKVGSPPVGAGTGTATSLPVAASAASTSAAGPRIAPTPPPPNRRGLGSSTHSTSRNKRSATATPSGTTPFDVSASSTPFVRASKRVSTDHSPAERGVTQAPGPRDGQEMAAVGQSDGSSGVIDGATPTTHGNPSSANRGSGVPMPAAAAEAAAAKAAAAQHGDASGKQQVEDDDDASSTGPVSRRVSVTP
jgi:HSP20 family molecular chaperone IbpA